MAEQAVAFRKAFRTSQHIVVIACAGLSAASVSIPTFRDGGLGRLWRSLDATALATPRQGVEAKTNAAHEVLARMSDPTYLKKVAPSAMSFHLVTQNVDRLSCTQCNYRAEDRTDPLCPALGAADASFNNYNDAGSKEANIPVEQLPRCPECGTLTRPGVINTIVYNADMCLVIGTLRRCVGPASTYAYRVQRRGGKVAVFNLDPSKKDERADFVFRGGCETVLPALFLA
ncbi:DHS-like NAD/FAD-binding domain-containing protein [Mycena sp. CBHHK59/15]|nr:DHS-like NAD/FAD-binding domain-containing protein [Mycena sp. CBHHK59/15]